MKASLLFVFAIALVACNPSSRNSDRAFGEERPLEGVSKLRIKGVFNLHLTQSDQEYLSFDEGSELAEKLKITQIGDLLVLEMEEELNTTIFSKKEFRVDLSLSNLEELEFEGVGNVETEGKFTVDKLRLLGNGVGKLDLEFQGKELDIKLNMVGKTTLRGTSDRVYLKNEGIGNIDASQLIAQDMEVESSGIGKMDINCVGDLSLQVNGIGKITYRGNPRIIAKDVNGIGKVEAY